LQAVTIKRKFAEPLVQYQVIDTSVMYYAYYVYTICNYSTPVYAIRYSTQYWCAMWLACILVGKWRLWHSYEIL